MPTKAERTALLFVSAVILVGGAVRLVRSARGGLRPPPAAATALAQQRRATDSIASAPKDGSSGESRGRKAGRGKAPKPPPPPEPSFPIDVDQATSRELEALPRIGPALAGRIIAERTANGPFGSLEALDQRVKGIGPAMAAALRQFVTFSGR